MNYDNFIKQNMQFYKDNFLKKNYPDLYDGKITKRTLLYTMLKKSETALTHFNENKVCKVCKTNYIYNTFHKNSPITENYCAKWSCNQKYRNNNFMLGKITLKQANHLVTSLHKNKVTKADIQRVLRRYNIIDKHLLRFPKLYDKLFYVDFLNMWLIDTSNIKTSSMLSELILHYNIDLQKVKSKFIVPKKCIHCNNLFDYNIFTTKQKLEKFCSTNCYKLHKRSNPEMFITKATLEGNKRTSKILKQKILDGKFTPCVTNSWCKSRIVVNNIPFRSSWEAYFYIFKYYVDKEDIKFEKLRVPYFSSETNKNRIYIVDFIDYKNKIVYEVKPDSEKLNITNKEKAESLIKWCKHNNYKYQLITDIWFRKYYSENIVKINVKNSIITDKLINRLKQFKGK